MEKLGLFGEYILIVPTADYSNKDIGFLCSAV